MCEACFVKSVRRFPSQHAFTVFEQQLAGTNLHAVERPAEWPVPPPLTSYEPEAFYQCHTCHDVWALASPDNAWRGYFLPVAAARTYQRQLRRQDARIKYVALLVVAVVLWWAFR